MKQVKRITGIAILGLAFIAAHAGRLDRVFSCAFFVGQNFQAWKRVDADLNPLERLMFSLALANPNPTPTQN